MMSNVTRLSTIAGFLVAAIAVVLVFVLDDRAPAFWVFLVGFLLVAGGALVNMFSAAETLQSRWMALGMKVVAAGIAIALCGALYELAVDGGSASIFWSIGFGVLIVGVAIGAFGLLTKSQ